MKTLRHIQFCLFALLAGAAFTACNEEDPIAPTAAPPVLGGEETVQTETDRWLYENYVVPFNIDVEYKWDATDMMPSIDKQLVPVDEELVIPFMQVMYEKLLAATSRTTLSMISQLVGAIVNIILDPIFIFGYCGEALSGTTGAALATVIGQFCGAGVSFYLNLRKNPDIQLDFTGFRPRAEASARSNSR